MYFLILNLVLIRLNYRLMNMEFFLFPLGKLMFVIISTILILLICVAYLTLMERKVIAAMQIRVGPNVNGPFGLLQPIFDGVKLLLKEPILPTNADKPVFLIAPIVTFTLALIAWAVIPFWGAGSITDVNLGLIYLLAISSLGVYGVILSGWSSGSRYPFFGAMRSASQMISYEVVIGMCILSVATMANPFNLQKIVVAQNHMWFVVPLFPIFIVFFIAILAETNRHPFDLPEAEAELVAGFNTEYSSMQFAAFFLGEYANMILMSALCSIVFLGGWLPPTQHLNFVPSFVWMPLKTVILLFVFIWVRASLPRYRYDQLMKLSWKFFLPISMFGFLATATFVFFAR